MGSVRVQADSSNDVVAPASGTPAAIAAPRRRTDELLPDDSRNEVRLVGRLGVGMRELTMPSGDSVISFHLVVSRPARSTRERERRPREPTVDTLACAAWSSRSRRMVAAAQAGDVLDVEGALRRRFRRATGGAPVSFYEIEVSKVRRLRRATS